MRSGNQGRVIEQMRALAAELTACASEFPTAANNSAPALAGETPRALSTRDVARLLGVSAYTVNEWARLGRLRCRQDSPGGRRHFDAADVAAYMAEHTSGGLPEPLAGAYSSGDDNNSRGAKNAPPKPETNPSATSGRARGHAKHGRPVGTRRAPVRPLGSTRPFTPGHAAWHTPVEKPPNPEG